MSSGKQPAGLKLTSGSGEQTLEWSAITGQQEEKELIPDWHWGQLYHGHYQADWSIVNVRPGWTLGGFFSSVWSSLISLNAYPFRS